MPNNNGHVVIGIDGDASGFEQEAKKVERSAKSAAAALGHEYAKAGMSLSDGMRKAWVEIQRAQRTGTTVTINGVETIISKNEQLIRQKDDLGNVYDEIGDSSRKAAIRVRAGLADIKAGIDMAVTAARALGSVAGTGLQYNAEIERLQTSFEVMTGSAEKAAEVVSRLRTMGAETPFETADLAATTQLLMQYGMTADDALDKMRMLGDVAQGNKEALSSIALGYAQMSSAQKVNLQDIKQMINGGFNPLQEISERTGESMNSLYDRISKGTMTVDEITASLRAATSEGGKFFGSMEKQSQTLNGQLSTLKDNASQLLGSLTEGLAEELRTELLPLANNMIAELEEAFDQRGIEGLIDAATGMLPDLLNMMTGRMEDSIASLSRFAPQAVTAIMRSIPGAIRSASSVLPQITAALFETAGLVVQEMVVMLPDLIPVVVSGFAEMFASALYGVGKLVGGFYDGIEQAIHKGQTKVMGLWVDKEKVAKYDFSVDVTVDETTAATELATGINNIIANIGTTLTDGLPDVQTTISGLEQDVRTWADEAYAQIQAWYDSEIETLNASGKTGEEYDAALLEIETKAETMRSGVQEAEVGAINFLNSMAGKSTAYVQQHLGELEAIGKTAEEVAGQIDALTSKARTAASSAFEVVRAGASADEATIQQAVKFKFTEFQLDTQSAEDAYAATVEELNTLFDKGTIGKEEYNARTAEAEAELATAKESARIAFEKGYGEILAGIAESEGTLEALDTSAAATQAQQMVNALMEEINKVGWDEVDPSKKAAVAGKLTELLGESFNAESMALSVPANYFGEALSQLGDLIDESNTTILEGKIGGLMQSAIEQGILQDTSFDTSSEEAQLASVLTAIFENAKTTAKPEATTAGEELGQAGADGAGNTAPWTASANNTTDALLRSLRARKAELRKVGAEMGIAVNTGYNNAMQIKSPSRVMMQAGEYTGQGLEIGLRKSIERARAVAVNALGGIATAAALPRVGGLSALDIQQAVTVAREESPTILNINGKEFARATASDTNTVQNSFRRSIALGVGK